MTFDISDVLESKRVLRRRLASLPVAEKLAMLDTLRDRARTIRKAAILSQGAVASEYPPGHGVSSHKD